MKLKNFVKFLLSQHFFDIFILSISWTVGQASTNHVIFWKNTLRTFGYVYINFSKRLTFITEVSAQICKKCTIFGNFKAIIKEVNMETTEGIFSRVCFCNLGSQNQQKLRNLFLRFYRFRKTAEVSMYSQQFNAYSRFLRFHLLCS